MRNQRPMPSPTGSNNARQYLHAGFPSTSTGAAYDSAEGLGEGVADKVMKFLEGKLSEEDLASVGSMLDNGDDMSLDSDGENQDPRTGTSGLDRPKVAQDGRMRLSTAAAEREFFRRFPAARRIGRL